MTKDVQTLMYGAGVILLFLPFARVTIELLARGEKRYRKRAVWRADKPLVDTVDKGMSLVCGFVAALLWPVTLGVAAVLGVAWLLMRSSVLTPSVERERVRQKERDEELERLRKLVKEFKIKGGESL